MNWSRLTHDLPYDSPVHVICESSKNKNLLFAGTEHGLFASIDGGVRWQKVKNGLPPAVAGVVKAVNHRGTEGTEKAEDKGRLRFCSATRLLPSLCPLCLCG